MPSKGGGSGDVKSLDSLCKPRESVFDRSKRDTVLDLASLARDEIDPREFFEENWITEGMKTLLRQAFLRLEGRSSQGLFRLTQAMGGGKTHNLLALGLLAKHPQFRVKLLEGIHKVDPNLGAVKVVAFSGRESDARFGLWGAIADQLKKRDDFREYYSPLRAPGQSAWQNLLKGETALILLDELPPYFQNARSIAIGNILSTPE
jgi:predicted AAA+ superfamily ATPase